MMDAIVAEAFLNSPTGSVIVGAACVAMITVVTAALKIVLQLTRLEQTVKSVHDDIAEMKSDPDVMRWSNYGRAMQATQSNSGARGGNR